MGTRDPHIPDDSDLRHFVERLRGRGFDEGTCFLCARSLQEVGSTREHVIPRWAQNRYKLWEQHLRLLNNTRIPYRNLTIPCCDECNKYRLQPIETSVANAVSKGHQAVRSLGFTVLFLWLGKIFYGVLYKELFLLLDRTSQNGITIASPSLLNEYENHLFFLQQAREKVELVDFCPGSIFVFNTQAPKDARLQWDICDNVDTMFIAVRMGRVGIIGVLQDGGAQQGYEEAYKDLMDLPLHPFQFRELCAHFSYRSSITTRTPKYVTLEGLPHRTYQLPLAGLSAKPLFEEWDEATYAKYLSFYTGLPYELIFSAPDRVTTWLQDESGRAQYIDFEKYPDLPRDL